MKKTILFCLLFAFIGFHSCKKEQKQDATDEVQNEISMDENCYKAIFQWDTLDLKIHTLKNGKTAGELVMNIYNEPNREGEIMGEFKGDTLICSYTFTTGSNKKVTYKNPMAFLKKGDSLVLGVGEFEMYLGATYFKKDKPINFDNVRYKFSSVDCADKK